MKSFGEQLFTYKQQHSNALNRLLHYIGIPAIVFSLLMLLNWLSIDIARTWVIPFSWFLLLGALVYYFFLNVRVALLTTVIMIPITYLAIWIAQPTPTLFSSTVCLVLFFGGWILQFTGHFFEKSRPAFLQSITQLLIGPLFIIVEILTALKIDHYFIKKGLD